MEDAQSVENSLNDEYYHHEGKCKLEVRHRYTPETNKTLTAFYYYCHTHKCEVCRCGWQIGWHYGTQSDEPRHDIHKIRETINEFGLQKSSQQLKMSPRTLQRLLQNDKNLTTSKK